MTWVRGDGWPRWAARWCVLASFLGLLGVAAVGRPVPSGWWALALLPLSLGLVLGLWRRGVTLNRETGELVHWYGLGPLRRRLQSRSIAGFDRVAVEARGEHFKRWPEMYAVVLRRGWERVVVDDEYARPEPAHAAAQRVADYLEATWDAKGITSES